MEFLGIKIIAASVMAAMGLMVFASIFFNIYGGKKVSLPDNKSDA